MLRVCSRRFQFRLLAGSRSHGASTTGTKEKCVNRVQLLGRVGVEPKVFGRESQLVSFPLGTSQRFRVNNEDGSVSESYRTIWHLLNIRIPGLREYALNYIRKGSRLLVSGRLDYSQTTREDGSTKDHAIIVVDDIIILATPRSTTDPESLVDPTDDNPQQ